MEPLPRHRYSCARLGHMRTRSLNHSVYQIQYHVVWGTKFRRKYLKEYVLLDLKKSLYAVVKKYPTLYIHKLATDNDHIHMQIEIPPNLSIARVVQQLKIETSIHLKKKFKFIREMYLDSSIWSVGYFVSMIGVNEATVRQYLDKQGKKDLGQNYKLGFS